MTTDINPFIAPPCHTVMEVVYRDQSLLLINKPSGLLSLTRADSPNQDSVYNRLLAEFPSARLIHRLDFGTSGLMLVALNKRIAKALNLQFSRRLVQKRYTALLSGWIGADQGIIDCPIDKGVFPRQRCSFIEGRSARSLFYVLERGKMQCEKISRVEFQPLTGRTHQLRLHSQFIGHDMLGCDLYAKPEVTALMPRLCLHASQLEFQHPESGKHLNFKVSAPF